MASGDAQFWTHLFADASGVPYAGVKVYRYASGTSNLKDAWVDAGRSTVDENPSLGDSFGRVSFYADGDYRLHVVTNDGVSLYDWDPVRITADTATMWENNQGTAYPPASMANQGQLFAVLDGSSKFQDIGINDTGTGFTSILPLIRASTYAGLPTSETSHAGWLRRLTDNVRGIWMDSGTQWFSTTAEVVNVIEFGAKGDGVTDDTAAFQAALDAVDALGGGIVDVPPGTYILTSVRLGDKTWLRGAGYASFLKSTTTSVQAGIVINKLSPQYTGATFTNILADGNKYLHVSDFRMEAQPVDAVSGNFHCFVHFMYANYCLIERIWGTHNATANTGGSGYGDKGIQMRGCNFSTIQECYLQNVPDNAYGLDWPGAALNDAAHGFYGHNALIRCVYRQTQSWSSGFCIPSSHYTLVKDCDAIYPPPVAATHNFAELGDECNGVMILGNRAIECGMGVGGAPTGPGVTNATFAENLLVSTSSAARITISSHFGPTNGVLVANNRVTGGSISASAPFWGGPLGTGSPCTNVVMEGNMVSGGTYSGMGGEDVLLTNLVIRGNYVYGCGQAGIKITGKAVQVVVSDNVLRGNGITETAGANGNSAGIYMDGCDGARAMRNVTNANNGYGIWAANTLPFPTGMDVIDNISIADVTGALKTQDQFGATIVVRRLSMEGAGSPAGVYSCMAGSVYWRTDPVSASTIQYLKQSGIDASGWVAVTAS